MAKIGNIGYGIYKICRENYLVLSPSGSHLIKIQNNLEQLLDTIVDEVEEEDLFLDYKINKGGFS